MRSQCGLTNSWHRFAVRDKDSLIEDKPTNAPHPLSDYLLEKGFVIGHAGYDQEKLANSALDEGNRFFCVFVFAIILISRNTNADCLSVSQQSCL